MKKILVILLIIVATCLLVACQNNKNEVGKERTLEPIEGSVVPYLEGGYVNVWADEFDGEALDTTKWNYEINGDGGGNQELQYYTGQNAIVSDGTLKIIAKQEQYLNRMYTSSRITTKYKGVFKYGLFQARMKLPKVGGLWPAFWMMPMQSTYGTWPRSGEIDIMEYVGRNPGKVFSTLHTHKYNHMYGGGGLGWTYDVPNEDEWHIYELEWLPASMTIKIDGEVKAQFKYNPETNPNFRDRPYEEIWPFDEPFFIILNLAVGGTFGGTNIDNAKLPAAFEIDYVRVYQIDAPYYDTGAPSYPINITEMPQVKNGIYWHPSSDDIAVDHYEIYINGSFHDRVNLHQYTFKGLSVGQTYQVTIRAVDLAGNVSSFSEPVDFTYQA